MMEDHMPANTRPAWQWTAALPLLLLAAGCTGMVGQPTATASKPVLEQEPVADFSTCSKPVYPLASRKAKEAGAVMLRFQISAEGKVEDASVVSSSGYPLLDEAARSSIAKCGFKPGIAGGKPVSSPAIMQYVWRLD